MPLINNFFDITPTECLKIDFKHSVEMVKKIIGASNFELAKQLKIQSPLINQHDSSWLKHSKIIGINPRIVETYWGIVKYAMTFPENAIHIMPLFESGDGSLYVQNSWRLNNDFYDVNLENLGFNTAESQLKFVINILHAMGKSVGFDALPHVDNFSEIVILNPDCFEWVKLNKEHTAEDCSKNRSYNPKEIERLLINEFNLPNNFFEQDENLRKKQLFPDNIDAFSRRMQIRKVIRENGYEPVPVVELSPMRPIVFKGIKHSQTENWAEFEIPNKNNRAKIIGSITPYNWYEIDDRGYIKKNAKRDKVWNYFINHMYEFQKEYNFDFLRADMGHNQISHAHMEDKDFQTNEFWGETKDRINKDKPYFATLGEAFLSTYYIDANNDMTNKKFDIVLGNLNFQYLNEVYTSQILQFIKNIDNNSYLPCNTIYTNDGDLPSHQKLFQSQDANILRYFMGLFFNLPSYMGMGFEVRNLFPQHEAEFSNYYVKPQNERFQFGQNLEQFNNIVKMRELYSSFKNTLESNNFILHKTNSEQIFCWSYLGETFNLLFIANFDSSTENILINNLSITEKSLIYTNASDVKLSNASVNVIVNNLFIGECSAYVYKK